MQSATATGIKTFRNESQDYDDLALRSERETTGLNQAEKIVFEYWLCFLVLIHF